MNNETPFERASEIKEIANTETASKIGKLAIEAELDFPDHVNPGEN